jgi:type II restriction enzyme
MPQKARIVTESWVAENMYCPICGNNILHQHSTNKPVADFYCSECSSDYELKSKSYHGSKGRYSEKIIDGAYSTMIERITSQNNPNLLYMIHNNFKVTNFLFVPHFFFVPSIIEKRSPLKETARRAGWVGCNIKLENVPNIGKILIIDNGTANNALTVLEKCKKAKLLQTAAIDKRSWLLDVLACVDRLDNTFNLSEMYAFEKELSEKHPLNDNVRPKIRQQLQLLRGKNIIVFLGNGRYKKT